MSALELLEREVNRFKDWADRYPCEGRSGEWETYYEDWQNLYEACAGYLGTPIETWSEAGIRLLLYAIARDNECEIIADDLTREQLLLLARSALESAEPEAKWQLSVALAGHPDSPEADAYLRHFAQDPDEYVRRRALMALAQIGSPVTEELAERAWMSGELYQRIACLRALHTIRSRRLGEFVQKAAVDGREYVVQAARQVGNSDGEFSES